MSVHAVQPNADHERSPGSGKGDHHEFIEGHVEDGREEPGP